MIIYYEWVNKLMISLGISSIFSKRLKLAGENVGAILRLVINSSIQIAIF